MRLESQGALSFVDRALFPSNMIYDSFAIVDTSPVAHVHVMQENRASAPPTPPAAAGADMRAFDLNHIAIEPTDIPPEATLDNDKRELRPRIVPASWSSSRSNSVTAHCCNWWMRPGSGADGQHSNLARYWHRRPGRLRRRRLR